MGWDLWQNWSYISLLGSMRMVKLNEKKKIRMRRILGYYLEEKSFFMNDKVFGYESGISSQIN